MSAYYPGDIKLYLIRHLKMLEPCSRREMKKIKDEVLKLCRACSLCTAACVRNKPGIHKYETAFFLFGRLFFMRGEKASVLNLSVL